VESVLVVDIGLIRLGYGETILDDGKQK